MRAEKELVRTSGTQIDFYDAEATAAEAAGRVAAHFIRTRV
ncbi:hypothetical protein [Streptacidiphilus jiangxiensis]|uniref:Uncharacterized protein n=1 Tax=Streptacidiphilus jiangxiensis TaxID=235985 RepID=A0A1H7TVG1_STRJI|nr:hypothetical protein [Streptacidiphilus jiangxiensis]SEL88643.1 hypothetical protein SAMN05414137_114225 [Streptacidiphilus jiangxiensis]